MALDLFNSDPVGWHTMFGTGFVAGCATRAWLSAFISIRSSNRFVHQTGLNVHSLLIIVQCCNSTVQSSTSVAVKASWNGLGMGGSATAKIDKSMEKFQSEGRLTARVAGSGLDSRPFNCADMGSILEKAAALPTWPHMDQSLAVVLPWSVLPQYLAMSHSFKAKTLYRTIADDRVSDAARCYSSLRTLVGCIETHIERKEGNMDELKGLLVRASAAITKIYGFVAPEGVSDSLSADILNEPHEIERLLAVATAKPAAPASMFNSSPFLYEVDSLTFRSQSVSISGITWRRYTVVFSPGPSSGPFHFEAKGNLHHGIEMHTSAGRTGRVYEAYSRPGVGYLHGALNRPYDFIEFWADPKKEVASL
jgi:hypothetical protein